MTFFFIIPTHTRRKLGRNTIKITFQRTTRQLDMIERYEMDVQNHIYLYLFFFM